jgi:hypothetical protein
MSVTKTEFPLDLLNPSRRTMLAGAAGLLTATSILVAAPDPTAQPLPALPSEA